MRTLHPEMPVVPASAPALRPLTFAVVSALCCLYAGQALALDVNALPTNGQVTAGAATISENGNVMNVVQSSDRMAATWNTFNIGSGAQVNFVQPSSSSVALNRVTSGDASQIMGQLNANGQVYLINPSGILFGQGSAVNVGGLVASALPISDANFMAGNTNFDASGAATAPGTVINQGTITAGDGGYVVLLGSQVRNEGAVIAKLGHIMLGAGEKVTLDFNGDGLINMEVNDASAGAAVINSGLLQANGGTVVMSARSSDALLSNVVNNEGIIEATSLQNRNGTVLLDGGDTGIVAVSGAIDVSGRNAGETGGTVKALGQYVGLFDGARIDASGDAGGGTVLIGGNYQGSGAEHQADSAYMAADAVIRADALNSGDGGKVVLWSTGSTEFYGAISVLGGGRSGAGGVVETSGHDLDAWGSVNLSAASGRGGSWLIDPFNINITSGASSGATSSSPFTSSGSASSNLSSATLNSSLSEGANVLVITTAVGGTSGDINVLDNIQGVGNATLTLQAHRNIIMKDHSISNGAGKTLNVSLFSNFSGNGNGSVALTNSTISTNGGAFMISGGTDPATGYASTTQNGAFGVSLNNSTISTAGGDITIRGAASGNSNSNATQIASHSVLNAGSGNISISGNVAAGGTGDAVILTSGSSILTSGAGSIAIDGTNFGSGNGTRVFSTNNTIAAAGSGNVTISGNASSGFGVLICSTAATSSQSISVGSGNLTVQANANNFAGAGRGVYLAAGGNGNINLNATAGGNIALTGSSNDSYGLVFNSTGAGSVIGISTAGDIALTGTTSGGSTPALALVSSGDGTSLATASQINIAGRGNGNVRITANNTVVDTSTSSFRGLFLNASGAFASINLGTQAGSLTLDGTSFSGRGVDIAPSGANAVINISATSGPILISGNSTSSFGGYGILFNSTGSSTGVNVNTVSGDITLRGDSIGTSDAIALGGDSTASTNNISSQGGNIMLAGNFHSPNLAELDHGIALLEVNNLIQTTGAGNITMTGTATDQGNGVSFYNGGNAVVSVQDGALNINGNGVYNDGIGFLTGTTLIRATGNGSVSLTGVSDRASGIEIFPSTAAGSVTISTVTGKLSLSGSSNANSAAPAVALHSVSGGNGVNILSASGDIAIEGATAGSGEAVSIIGSDTGATNTIATGGSGNMNISAIGSGSYGLRFAGGTNNLTVVDGTLLITARAGPGNGTAFGQSADITTIAATGAGSVIKNFGGQLSNVLTDPGSASTTASVQSAMTDSDWMAPIAGSGPLSPFNDGANKVSVSVSDSATDPTADFLANPDNKNPGKEDDTF
ncbi:MAG TPA: filamentous hemagglutinin N-terminal domain-containing protein [Herbaspirillum sp.]